MRRALVVDDHPSFRRSARALLVEEGFEVVGEAEDGATALALAEELVPDLILLDVQLPDIDGFEVASRLLAPRARVEDRARVEPRCERLREPDRSERSAWLRLQGRALRGYASNLLE